jgi:S-(hydroxymethyl)glutathione dehydrogenase/alcohol dehydrogenase
VKSIAAILVEQNKPLEIDEVIIPKLLYGQVLVKIFYSGICRTQFNEIKGYKGKDPYLPHTLGHEASGEVLEIGTGVTKVKVSDHVVVTWIKGAGINAGGAVYTCGNKKINSGPVSTFLQYAVISENCLVPISKDMPLKQAALLGCSFATGAGIIFNEMKSFPKSSLAIFGLGGIGFSALLAAKIRKMKPIIVVDINEKKLKEAISFGADFSFNANDPACFEKILNYTNNMGLDFSLEATGNKKAMELSFLVTKKRGGLCILAGNLPEKEKIEINPFHLIEGRNIRGTWGGGTEIDKHIPIYIEHYLKGNLNLNSIIINTIDLKNINDLFFSGCDFSCKGRGMISFV